MTENRKPGEVSLRSSVSSRSTLLSLVQGLGIKLPTEVLGDKSPKGQPQGSGSGGKPRTTISPRRFAKRQGGSRPASPKHPRSPQTKSPRSLSPPASPRANSPPRISQAFVIAPPRPITSQKLALPSKPDSVSAKKPQKIVPRRTSTLNSPLKLAMAPKSMTAKPQMRKKMSVPDAPAPLSITPTQRDFEATMTMVSPRIDLDMNYSPSARTAADSGEKKTTTRGKKAQETRSLVLKSLVTKVDTSSDPADVGKSKSEVIYRKHLYQTFRGLKMARSLPPADPIQLQAKRVVLMKPPGKYRRKTAIFDLDETLVHCLDRAESAVPDVVLPIRFPNGDIVHVSPTQANIKIRPYCTECLTQVSQEMELIVFTASQRSYADTVMNYLDPTRTLIHHRLYRESCVITERIHIKDLRVLANRSQKDIVLIDNAAYSFGYQLDNGIPIVSWHDDPDDKELLYLTEYLKGLLSADDVREVNQATFHLATFYSDYSDEFLAKVKAKLK